MMSETDILSSIHKALIGFDKRAERSSDEILEATFVDSAPHFDLLSSKNNQVIYGRRGTGKTHALKYLARYVEKTNERPIYIDLRSVGSNGSIYSDGSRPSCRTRLDPDPRRLERRSWRAVCLSCRSSRLGSRSQSDHPPPRRLFKRNTKRQNYRHN